MTYCVGILVSDGLVFGSDTRTSASFDDVRVHNKMHVFEFPGDRVLVLMSAGHLGTTQRLIARLERDMKDRAPATLLTHPSLIEVAEYVGQCLVDAQHQSTAADPAHGVNLESTIILGGQVGVEPAGLFLIYPQGNCISSSPETPFMQIGESKYGKPVLEQVLKADTSLDDAARCAIVSLDSTIRCNVSVGLPIDLLLLRNGALQVSERIRLDSESPLYTAIQRRWSATLVDGISGLERMPWEVSPPAGGPFEAPIAAAPPAG